ncbi:50S ribosomal protein L3 [Blattabacterium sp. (Blattella germanica) str. Bge]|uniref:50S ribosomal protein L3 n=1 Tax=Blattabacterium sp. (Blattella germanica) TaxID=624186 RepID=UPI0001BB6138|nr:50S ribosomal protein L3 [Blattabacterium sp. (Blattella germanica)]ACY40258.1 50S ribosomal protein L3 [Blattabacterium sp. (Blattella germanica) str. Bge]
MSGLIGKNIGMTSIFLENGKNVPCTVIKVNPCYVIQIKTVENDGYFSVQLGTGEKKLKKTNNPLLGHFKKSGLSPRKKLLEFRENSISHLKLGEKVSVDTFKKGELVNVKGISKGKGFQGVVKRHNFSGVGERSHGQHNRLRSPGSIGAGSDPSRVFKGKKMAGKMGKKNITVKNLEILKIDIHQNLIILKGSVPGNKNSYLMINKKKWN